MIGTRVGVYEVVAKLGEGGMGAVYRATDTTLGRQVAIKVLPEAFAADAERLARFEREAKTLASLNHPHIAAIYGLEKGRLGQDGREGQVIRGHCTSRAGRDVCPRYAHRVVSDAPLDVAVAAKLSALRTEEYFSERTRRGDVRKALRILKRAGVGQPPVEGDELPVHAGRKHSR